jgi:hypothetical protein
VEAEVEEVYEIELEAEPLPDLPPEPEPAPSYSPASTVYQPIPVSSFQSGSGSLSAVPAAPVTPVAPLPEPEPPAPVFGTAAQSPDQTVLLPRTPFAAASAAAPAARETREIPVPVETAPAPPLRPVPVVEPPLASAAAAASAAGADGVTPEVRPPSGVDGPGWAFSASRAAVSPSDEALHEEARRLARLLVSEIKLYNEEQVEEGRRKRDVYERLREDIDRSRQMYEERVDPRILRSTDYFYQELVRILAAGDAKALGI